MLHRILPVGLFDRIAPLTAGRTTATDNAPVHKTYPTALFREDLSDGVDRKVYSRPRRMAHLTAGVSLLKFLAGRDEMILACTLWNGTCRLASL